jgi:hypothetical protein
MCPHCSENVKEMNRMRKWMSGVPRISAGQTSPVGGGGSLGGRDDPLRHVRPLVSVSCRAGVGRGEAKFPARRIFSVQVAGTKMLVEPVKGNLE